MTECSFSNYSLQNGENSPPKNHWFRAVFIGPNIKEINLNNR